MTVKTEIFALQGGLNLVSPALSIPPGMAILAQNYEADLSGGYRRVDGYERFDGRTAPSAGADAAEIASNRSAIQVVPGGGAIRGVWEYSGTVYALRDDAATSPTECRMYKSSASGWVLVDLGQYLKFDSGSEEPSVGDQIYGVTSTATATVRTIVTTTGTFGGGDAAGYLYVDTVAGTFQDNEVIKNNTTTTADVATTDGTMTTITLSPGGDYEFVNYNFGGSAGSVMMYGCDGVNKAFQFDGTTFTQLTTGMTTDVPQHIAAHKNHLFLSFANGSLQHSSIGDPTTWTPVTGAAEMGIGAEITAIKTLKGDVLAVFGDSRIRMLYGTSAADWNLKEFSNETGAKEFGVQEINGDLIFVNEYGLSTLMATQTYGDFITSSISELVKPWIDYRVDDMRGTYVSRSKSQLRVFFGDKSSLVATFKNGELLGFTTQYMSHQISCVHGDYAGMDDGYVMNLDQGTSFDGSDIESYLRLPFNHLKSPSRNKVFRKIALELDSTSAVNLTYTPDLNYGDANNLSAASSNMTATSGGGYWEIAEWGDFSWSQDLVASAAASIKVTGRNMGLMIQHKSSTDQPFTLQGVILHYSMRGVEK